MLAPLQVIDNFLLNYNVGDALVVVFVLGLLGTLPFRSRRMTALHTAVFGLVFLLTPYSAMTSSSASFLDSAFGYTALGILLLVVAPVLYTTADR